MLPLLFLLIAALISCHPNRINSVHPTAGIPEMFHLPPGCDVNLAGAYSHAEDPTFHYQASDDGRTLILQVSRSPTEGGSAASTERTNADTSVVLSRSKNGFFGSTRAKGFTASGKPCAVDFPTEVVKCSERGFVIRTLSSMAFDETCLSHPNTERARPTDHRLLRDVTL